MRLLHRSTIQLLISGLALFAIVDAADAQLGDVRRGPGSSAANQRPKRTTVSVELFTGSEGVGLHAQQWQQVFAKLGVSFRARRAIFKDKPEVRERMLGSTRQVTVVGRLDRSGQIVLPDRTFRRSDAAKLAEWIRELKTFGAKGSPEGKQLWGLDKVQFSSLYSALGAMLAADLEGLDLETALAKMQLPARYPLRITTTARGWLSTEFPRAPAHRHSLKGLSKGTALAIVLNDYGLGFRPLRTPEGTIELAVDPFTKTTDVWPIGWEMAAIERRKAAPKMFQLVPVELEDVKLIDVLAAVSVKTDVPILIDHYRIAAKQIDLDNQRVSQKPSQVSWSLLIKRLANSAKLTREIKRDESGRPFVWISPLVPRRRQ